MKPYKLRRKQMNDTAEGVYARNPEEDPEKITTRVSPLHEERRWEAVKPLLPRRKRGLDTQARFLPVAWVPDVSMVRILGGSEERDRGSDWEGEAGGDTRGAAGLAAGGREFAAMHKERNEGRGLVGNQKAKHRIMNNRQGRWIEGGQKRAQSTDG